MLFEICEKRPFQKCMGLWGGGGSQFCAQSCKREDTQGTGNAPGITHYSESDSLSSSETDKNLTHVVGTACRPGVFQIALFKGFPNIPTYPYLSDTQWTQMRQQWIQPLKTLRVGRISTIPERYVSGLIMKVICKCDEGYSDSDGDMLPVGDGQDLFSLFMDFMYHTCVPGF